MLAAMSFWPRVVPLPLMLAVLGGCSLIVPSTDDYTFGDSDGGVPGMDADTGEDGAVPDAGPCLDGVDEDGDGVCASADCDDDDPARYPGNPEVCDAAGIDEDCDPSTFGVTDEDADGYIDAACCNGAVCGDDCDDSDPAISPEASELCDATDNDCDGTVDGAAATCPVGTCAASRCRAMDWERVYDGSALFDSATAVATDPEGNSYVRVSIPEGADLDDDGTGEPAGTHVVSYQPDGRVRWLRAISFSGNLTVAPDGSIALIEGRRLRRLDAADGSDAGDQELAGLTATPDRALVRTSGNRVVVALDVDNTIELIVLDGGWSEVDRLTIGSAMVEVDLHDVAASEAGIALTGETTDSLIVGSLSLSAGRFVMSLSISLAPTWRWALPEGLPVNPFAVAISATGRVAAGGENTAAFSPAWGEVPWDDPVGEGDAFAVVFESDGSHVFTHAHQGPAADVFARLDFDDRGALLMAGLFSGEMSVTPRGSLTAPAGTLAGFYALRDEESNFTLAAGAFAGSGTNFAIDVAADPFGGLLVVGRFHGDMRLVLGVDYTADGAAAYVLRVADFEP